VRPCSPTATACGGRGSDRSLLGEVRERAPDWRPTPSLRENVEGEIRAREAEARFRELQRVGIGPEPFAGESIPARGPERDYLVGERSEINGLSYLRDLRPRHSVRELRPGPPIAERSQSAWSFTTALPSVYHMQSATGRLDHE
jgi:hypothetical protein